MCGSKCPRCGEYEPMYGRHPRGCTLPVSTRQAIYYSGLPVDAAEAAIAAAEDKALEVWGRDYLRERRNEDALERARQQPPQPTNTLTVSVPDLPADQRGAIVLPATPFAAITLVAPPWPSASRGTAG